MLRIALLSMALRSRRVANDLFFAVDLSQWTIGDRIGDR